MKKILCVIIFLQLLWIAALAGNNVGLQSQLERANEVPPLPASAVACPSHPYT